MTTKTHFMYLFIAFGLYFTSCENNESTSKSDKLEGKVVNSTTCKRDLKSTSTPDTLSCIEYSFDASNQQLNIKHINAGFNCCPGDFSCDVKLNTDTIIIQEFESSSSCDCVCMNDLDIEVTGVEKKKYLMKFIEPYAEDVAELLFEIDLTKTEEGEYCVTRKKYPWRVNYTPPGN